MYNILVAITTFDSPLAIRTLEEAVSIYHGQEESTITLLHVTPVDTGTGTVLGTQTPMMFPYGAGMTIGGGMVVPSVNSFEGSPEEHSEMSGHESDSDEITDRAGEWLKGQGVRFESVSLSGNPAHEICQYAEDHAIALIVIGHRDRSTIERFFLGSVSKHVIESSPVSVLVVK